MSDTATFVIVSIHSNTMIGSKRIGVVEAASEAEAISKFRESLTVREDRNLAALYTARLNEMTHRHPERLA